MKPPKVPTESSGDTGAVADRPCAACRKGTLVRVVISETLDVGGHSVFLEGLMPYQCSVCGERTWPESERRRVKEQAQVRLGKAA